VVVVVVVVAAVVVMVLVATAVVVMVVIVAAAAAAAVVVVVGPITDDLQTYAPEKFHHTKRQSFYYLITFITFHWSIFLYFLIRFVLHSFHYFPRHLI